MKLSATNLLLLGNPNFVGVFTQKAMNRPLVAGKPYHHKTRKLLVPCRALADGNAVVRVVRYDVDSNLRCTQVLHISFVQFFGISVLSS